MIDGFLEIILNIPFEYFRKISESFGRGWDKQYPENHIYFLNIIVVIYKIYKNKYSALGVIKTMV